MSRVKAEKSDVKILNRGKVAGKTKGPETPPPPSNKGWSWGLCSRSWCYRNWSRCQSRTDFSRCWYQKYWSRHWPIRDCSRCWWNWQDLSWRDCSSSSSSVIKNRFQTFFAWWPSDRVADGIWKFLGRHFFLKWPSGRVAEFLFS